MFKRVPRLSMKCRMANLSMKCTFAEKKLFPAAFIGF